MSDEESKAQAIEESIGALRSAASATMSSNAPRKVKFIMLRLIADRYGDAVKPHAPCRKGCSSCCYQAVAISLPEALLLSQASGRRAERINRGLGETYVALTRAQTEAYGVPCPFLSAADGICTVYEHRPMACRVHHVLNETAAQCDVTKEKADAPIISMHPFGSELVGETALMFMDQPVGDIREFFR